MAKRKPVRRVARKSTRKTRKRETDRVKRLADAAVKKQSSKTTGEGFLPPSRSESVLYRIRAAALMNKAEEPGPGDLGETAPRRRTGWHRRSRGGSGPGTPTREAWATLF